MRMTVDRLGLLQEYGLSEYQARVYLALLEFPALNAGALAKAAQIPRNRLYEVLEELQGLGLVEIILDETRRYRANPLSSYLDRSVSDLRDRIQRIESQKAYLGAAFAPPALSEGADLEAGATRVLLTRRAVARELDRLVEGAKHGIVAMGSTGGWERIVRHLEKASDAMRDKGRVEVFLPRSVQASGGWERLHEPWVEALRWVDAPLRTLIVVADEAEMCQVHPMPDDEHVRLGRDFGLLTTNSALVQDALSLLRAAGRGRGG